MVIRSVLKRASMCTWKQMSAFGGSRDICQSVSGTDWLISQWVLIALTRFGHRSKGLLKGFPMHPGPWELCKYLWSYGQMKFVTHWSSYSLVILLMHFTYLYMFISVLYISLWVILPILVIVFPTSKNKEKKKKKKINIILEKVEVYNICYRLHRIVVWEKDISTY